MQQALHVGSLHSLMGGLSLGDDHPQYVGKQYFDDILQVAIPLPRFGAKPGGTADLTNPIQSAFDNVDAGSILYAPPGIYNIESIATISRSGISLWMAPGAVFQSSTQQTVLEIAGSTTAISKTLLVDVDPHRQDAIALNNVTDLAAGEWGYFEDTTATSDGGTTRQREMARIRSVDTGAAAITLYAPLVSGFTTAASATFNKIVPVEDVRIFGGGTITNTFSGGDGLKIVRASNVEIEGLTTLGVEAQGIKVQESLDTGILRCHFKNAPRFNGSNGYGVALTNAIRPRVIGCTGTRNRHSIDFTYWCRQVVCVGNTLYGAAQAPIMFHPDVDGATVVGNAIDGARGYDAGNTELGDNTAATGISIRAGCSNIVVQGNTIRNVNTSGIGAIESGCSNISIIGNTLENCNTRDAIDWGAISVGGGTATSSTMPGCVVRNNTISGGKRYGIVCAVDRAVISGNTINGILGSNKYGILVTCSGASDVARVDVNDNDIGNVDYGIVLGGTLLSGSGSVYKISVNRNRIRDTVKSGVYGNFTSGVALFDCYVNGNKLEDCNSSASQSEAAIRWYEENSVGVDDKKVDICDNTISGACRNGIYIGMSESLVARNKIHDVTDLNPVGVGIFLSSAVAGSTVRKVNIHDNDVTGCTTYGILVSSDSPASVGQVEECFVTGNRCSENGVNILEKDLTAGNRFEGNECFDAFSGTAMGIWVRGQEPRLTRNTCADLGAASQDYGIYVDTTVAGAILHDNTCYGNTSADISDSGTDTRYDEDEYLTTASAVNVTLKETTRHIGLTAATLTVTLPPVANVPAGHRIVIKDENTAGGHTIDGNASELIDGALTQPLGALVSMPLVMRNGAWWIE